MCSNVSKITSLAGGAGIRSRTLISKAMSCENSFFLYCLFKNVSNVGAPGWHSWLHVRLLIVPQVLISGSWDRALHGSSCLFMPGVEPASDSLSPHPPLPPLVHVLSLKKPKKTKETVQSIKSEIRSLSSLKPKEMPLLISRLFVILTLFKN